MGWLDGISDKGDQLRVKHGVFGFVPGFIVIGLGVIVHLEVDQGLLDQIDFVAEHRPVVGAGLGLIGLIWALWRKTVIFNADGSVTVQRHLLFLPLRKRYPRSEIYAIGTGADTSGVSWYDRFWREFRAEHTTYIGYVMFQGGRWTELFRCSGGKDFQQRIQRIKEFTGLPVRRN